MKIIKGIFVGLVAVLSWQPVMAQEVITGEALEAADLDRGKRTFLRCRSCHTLAEGDRNKVGPNLWGLFGNDARLRDDFKYSQAMQNVDFVWTPDKLNEWLVKPREFLPGTIMNFNGLPKEADRINLVAYLIAETGGSIGDIVGGGEAEEAGMTEEVAPSETAAEGEEMPAAEAMTEEPAAETPAEEPAAAE